MSLTQRIRVLSERAFERQTKIPGHPSAPDMRPFLAVPIRERLILLAVADNHSMPDIKKALPWAKETDIRLTSSRITEALAQLLTAMEEPTAWIDPGEYPEDDSADLSLMIAPDPVNPRTIPATIETQLRQVFFPSVTLMLFGSHVPPAVSRMSLQHRCLVYLTVVEEMKWTDVMRLMGCSKRQIHTALHEMAEALGGI